MLFGNVSISKLLAAMMLISGIALLSLRAAEEVKKEAAKPGGAVSVSNAGNSNQMELDIKLPLPMFDGTPPELRLKNLEPYNPNAPKPVIKAPKGTAVVSLKKEVTASDDVPIQGDLAMITDGNKEAPDGNYAELGPGKQWIQIDLGQAKEIYAILIWHFHKQARVYHDVVVQVSDDKDFVMGVKTVFNNDSDNSSGLGIGTDREYIEDNKGKSLETHGVKARFIRLYSKGSTSGDTNHYTEVEVWGKVAEK
ncbi:MAG: discoidin domain-containing protein [Candidatus Sumerlaeota bacterium]|nr:discoidin domain-containing protein [Candidatus Sumerlaeota bacterium]